MTVRVQKWTVNPLVAAWVLWGCTCVKETPPHANAPGRAQEQPEVEPDGRATASLSELLGKALKTEWCEGRQYFETVVRIVATNGAREEVKRWLASPGLHPRQKALGTAIVARLDRPAKYLAAERKAVALITDQRRHAHVIPEGFTDGPVWFGNPRTVPRDSEAGRTLAALSEETGLLAELLFKHDADTMAEEVVERTVEVMMTQYGDAAFAGRDRHSVYARLVELHMGRMSPSAKRQFLIGAWYLAARALVFAKGDDAVQLLEQAAAMGDREGAAVRTLGHIGSDTARQALERIGTPFASTVLQRLEVGEKKRRH